MPDLEAELRHLAAAERHVRDANARIAQLNELIAYASAMGESTTLARTVLVTMRDVLINFEAHHDQIVRTLRRIRTRRR